MYGIRLYWLSLSFHMLHLTSQQGIPGPPGDTGFTGWTGYTGASGVIGRIGEIGLSGAKGVVGQYNLKGIPGPVGWTGSSGYTGSKGEPGLPGLKGPAGATGIQGSDTDKIKGSIAPLSSSGPTLTPTTNKPTTSAPCFGPLGPPGRIGEAGVQGATGFPGMTGITGAYGPIGFRGMPGDTGPDGPPGDAGATGAPGETGPKGDAGWTGPPGNTGPTGPDRFIQRVRRQSGCPGPKGNRGSAGGAGATGVTGWTGATGSSGASGEGGFTGAFGVGTGYGQRGSPGQPGASGAKGSPGDRGVLGNIGATGATGDVYIIVIPSVRDIRPSFGPQAGGTRVTIYGRWLNVSTVQVGNYSIAPQYGRGGTLLTVIGSNLNSVTDPGITLTTVVTRPHNISPSIETLVSSQTCTFPTGVIDGSHMICRAPVLRLPPDFDIYLKNTSGAITDENSPGVAVYFGPNGRDRADIYVGLQLDGVVKYKNISANDPLIRLQFYVDPELSCIQQETVFNPNEDDVIHIKGSHLTRGSRLVDFVITVGDGLCDNVALTDNQIDCKPTKYKPNKENDTFCAKDLLSVQVSIGNAQYQCGCLNYQGHAELNVPLIVGLTVGLGVPFVIALVVIAGILIRRHKRMPTNNVDMPPAERHKNDDDNSDVQVIHSQLSASNVGYAMTIMNSSADASITKLNEQCIYQNIELK